MENNYFIQLFNTNVSDKIEKKNGLSYVSWAYAWAEVKKLFPDANYTIYERPTEYGAVPYFTDGNTCWVKTGMTINGIEHIEMLPIMDFKNRSIPLSAVTSMDINKSIQRSLTKAAARHGLGLYVYAGEDLPEAESTKQQEELPKPKEFIKPKAAVTTNEKLPELSPEMTYLNSELGAIAKESGMDMEGVKGAYKVTVQSLIKQGKLESKRFAEYSVDEIATVLDTLRKKVVKAS